MKKNAIFSMMAGAILLTSCGGGGVSEEFKKELAAFETEWNNAGNEANAFGLVLNSQDSTCNADMAGMMLPDSVKMNAAPEQITALDSMHTVCQDQSAKIAEIKTTFDGFKAGWDADTKAWGEWKSKVEKGEVKEEEAKTKLTEWKTKLEDAKKNLGEWKTALDAVTAECEATCQAHAAAVAAIPAAPVDAKGDKKKTK